MARPIKQGMDYFPHDTDASNDEKIEVMRAMYGNDGYVFYFILLERIYRTENAELDVSKTPLRMALISKVSVTKELFENMLETALDIGLFDKEEYEHRQVLTSPGIKKRFEEIIKMRQKWRKKKEKSGDSLLVIPGENKVDNTGENAEETGESKVKKSKEKKSKYIYADFVSMTQDEHQKLLDEFGLVATNKMIETLNNYKGATGKKYKSDYLAIRNWVVDRVKKDHPHLFHKKTDDDEDFLKKYGFR